jgi:hypothetical protein
MDYYFHQVLDGDDEQLILTAADGAAESNP